MNLNNIAKNAAGRVEKHVALMLAEIEDEGLDGMDAYDAVYEDVEIFIDTYITGEDAIAVIAFLHGLTEEYGLEDAVEWDTANRESLMYGAADWRDAVTNAVEWDILVAAFTEELRRRGAAHLME